MQQLSMLIAAMEHVLLSIYCTTIVKLSYAYCERQLAIFIVYPSHPSFIFLSVTRDKQKSLMGSALRMPKSSGGWLSCETSHTIELFIRRARIFSL